MIWKSTGDSGGGSKGPTPLEQHLYLAPTAVATALAFDRVGVGYGVSCMLTASGDAWCWGDNEHGQLGAASSTRCSGGSVPCSGQPLHAAPTLRFAEISPGQIHSCGLDAAGQAWCWGFGIGGQLGDGRSMDSAFGFAQDEQDLSSPHALLRYMKGGPQPSGPAGSARDGSPR